MIKPNRVFKKKKKREEYIKWEQQRKNIHEREQKRNMFINK